MGFDILAQHALVYPSLPSSTVNNPSKYKYLRIKLPSGATQIIAMEWINPATLESVNMGSFTVVIDNTSSSRQQKLLDTLAANNFPVKSITFESVL